MLYLNSEKISVTISGQACNMRHIIRSLLYRATLDSYRTAEAALSALPKRDPQWLEVKIGEFYGEDQPAGMSVPEFALTLVQLLQVRTRLSGL